MTVFRELSSAGPEVPAREGIRLVLEFLRGPKGWSLERVRFQPRPGVAFIESFRGDRFARAGRTFAWTKAMRALCLLVTRYVLEQESGCELRGGAGSPAQTLHHLLDHPERSAASAPFTGADGFCHLKGLFETINAGRDPDGRPIRCVRVNAGMLPPDSVNIRLLGGGQAEEAELRSISADLSAAWNTGVEAALPEAPEVDLGSFPVPVGVLGGREYLLEALEGKLAAHQLIQLIGPGGCGKTSVLRQWLHARLWETETGSGPARVFGWSFAEQSRAGEHTMSSDRCFQALLDFCKAGNGAAGSAYQRGAAAAKAAGEKITWIVLDGLETLQHPLGMDAGAPHDPALRGFLQSLSSSPGVRCVIASRLAIPGAEAESRLDVGPLDEIAAFRMLAEAGIHGSEAELRRLVRSCGCHPLSLRLLAGYLLNAHGGWAGAAVEGDGLLELADAGAADHARRILTSYEKLVEGTKNGALLHVLGLFDHGASFDELCDFIFHGPPLASVAGRFSTTASLKASLGELRNAGLVTSQRDGYQCHALIGHHFRRSFRERHPQDHRAAHDWLYRRLSGNPEIPTHPETREQYESLLRSFPHAREAGRLTECWRDIAWRRIMRGGREYHMTAHLGEFHLCLRTWASFWQTPWESLHPDLPDAAHPIAQASAGFALFMTDRIEESERVLRRALSRSFVRGKPHHALQAAAALGYVRMTQGRFKEACRILTPVAGLVRWVGPRTDAPAHVLMAPVCHLAYSLFSTGRSERATRLFAFARQHHAGREGWELPPLLLVTYWQFLIESGDLEAYWSGSREVLGKMRDIPLIRQLGVTDVLEAAFHLAIWHDRGDAADLAAADHFSALACAASEENGYRIHHARNLSLRVRVLRALGREDEAGVLSGQAAGLLASPAP